MQFMQYFYSGDSLCQCEFWHDAIIYKGVAGPKKGWEPLFTLSFGSVSFPFPKSHVLIVRYCEIQH